MPADKANGYRHAAGYDRILEAGLRKCCSTLNRTNGRDGESASGAVLEGDAMNRNGFQQTDHSVWDLGESLDPNPNTGVELDGAEKFLVAESLRTARRHIKDQEGSHHPDLQPQTIEREMEAHERRVCAIKQVVHDVRTGLPF